MRLIGHWQVRALLGRGGMGRVFKVVHHQIGRVAALKLLDPHPFLVQLLGLETIRRQFFDEGRTMARLHHPRLLEILDYGQHQGQLYFLMDFMGQNLGAIIGETYRVEQPSRLIRVDRALHYVRQILEGVECLHASGIIHRDIKPFNILIDDDDGVKIGDFGASMLRGEALPVPPNLKVGSPYYAAPEQEAAPEAVNPCADIYSIGVLFFRMLSGQLPAQPLQQNTWQRHGVDSQWGAFFERALATEPQRRFPDAAAMGSALEELAEAWRRQQEHACRLTAPLPAAAAVSAPPVQPRSTAQRVRVSVAREQFMLDDLWRPRVFRRLRLIDGPVPGSLQDSATGLVWQRGGCGYPVAWHVCAQYLAQLNARPLEGFQHWRLPTVAELTDLLRPTALGADFCADPQFDPAQRWLWSADTCTPATAWYVNFELGFVGAMDRDAYLHVKAVCTPTPPATARASLPPRAFAPQDIGHA